MDSMALRLVQAGRTSDLEEVPRLIADAGRAVGLDDVRIYIVDLRQRVLRELTGAGPNAGEGGTDLPVDGSLPGRAFQLTASLSTAEAGGRLWVPILDGTERLGVLRADARGPAANERIQTTEDLASLAAVLLVSKRSQSDSYARLRRTAPMTTAAELQWNLIPPLSFANSRVVVSAAMEPAHDVGGDAFDYAVAADRLHLAVFDAMGHDSFAGLTANLAVAACRNQRRNGADLPTTAAGAERVLVEHFGDSRYVTAVLAELNMATGLLAWTNHGHPPPMLIRGGRWTTTLHCPPSHPLGTALGLPVQVCHEQLEPGDRLLLYSDGVTDAVDRAGRRFGLDQFAAFIARRHADELPVPETLRRLIATIIEHHDGTLTDDATILFTEWNGPARNIHLRPQEGRHQPADG
ncbi:MAG TPA: PP2C family protein-serine/threonine phosphatase [Yinghuangia sp.]|nr:PP2C family protein-serine/threonine phosphatase [Yinghuangia sp.]